MVLRKLLGAWWRLLLWWWLLLWRRLLWWCTSARWRIFRRLLTLFWCRWRICWQNHGPNTTLCRLQGKNGSFILKILKKQINKKIRKKLAFQKMLTWTLKNGPIIWTVVSSSAGAVPCSGNLIMLPVTRCNSRTFWPPLPIMRPT